MAGERSPGTRRDPFPRVRVKVRDPFPRSQEGLSSGGVSPHPRETGRRVDRVSRVGRVSVAVLVPVAGLLQLLAVAVLVRRGRLMLAAAAVSSSVRVAVTVGVGLRSGLGVSVRVAVHPVDGDEQSRQFGWLLQEGRVQRGDERLGGLDVVIRGHRRHVDDADGGRAHSSGEPAGPRPLRHCQQPAQGEARTCE